MFAYDQAARGQDEQGLKGLLEDIRQVRQSTASPMVDQNLRKMEELCLHTLLFFGTDIDLHPYFADMTREQ
jgi:hypothetical protein